MPPPTACRSAPARGAQALTVRAAPAVHASYGTFAAPGQDQRASAGFSPPSVTVVWIEFTANSATNPKEQAMKNFASALAAVVA
jgi:hypothetical protein